MNTRKKNGGICKSCKSVGDARGEAKEMEKGVHRTEGPTNERKAKLEPRKEGKAVHVGEKVTIFASYDCARNL